MRTIVHEVDFDVGLQRLFAGDAERADEWLRQTVEDVLARETNFDADRWIAIGVDRMLRADSRRAQVGKLLQDPRKRP